MSQAYGPVATPHVFIFDRDRKLRFCGRIDDHENPAKTKTHDTRNALDALIAGKPVPVDTTRTFGCSVKWSDKRQSAADALAKWDQESADLKTIDAAGLARPRGQQVRQAPRDQCLGHLVRSLRHRISRAGDDSPHVSQSRLRIRHDLGRRAGESRRRTQIPQSPACVDEQLHLRQGRPLRARRCARRRMAGGAAVHAGSQAGRRNRLLRRWGRSIRSSCVGRSSISCRATISSREAHEFSQADNSGGNDGTHGGFWKMLAAIGPGIVVTGSVIGSGELINTPVQAATFGFILLWAVLLSCVIKYFLQVEIARHAMVENRTTFEAINECPGPKLRGTSWIGLIYMIFYVLAMLPIDRHHRRHRWDDARNLADRQRARPFPFICGALRVHCWRRRALVGRCI